MKIIIAYPPLKGPGSPMLTQNRQFQWYNVGSYIYPVVPAYAATLLKENGFDVIWKDSIAERERFHDFIDFLQKESPDLVAFETKTPVVRQHWKIINELKSILPGSRFVLMGDHVTAFPEESMKNSDVDFVITGGDYDFSLLSIARHLRDKADLEQGIWFRENGQVQNTGEYVLNHDLNSLPLIDRDLTKANLYGEKWKKRVPFMYTMAGRDCPWNKCAFCSWTTLFNKFRTRSVDSLLNEIGFLIERHGVREIFDDSGTLPGGNWLINFCEGMISRGYNKKILFSCNMRFDYLKDHQIPRLMKKAGFRKIKSGLESANQNTLKKINKGIEVKDIIEGCKNASEAGIDVHLTVMVGYPWETRKDAETTLNLARWLMGKGYAEMLQATVIIPYPGTPLYKYCKNNSLFRIDLEDYDRFDMREAILKTPDMGSQEIVTMCQGIYKSFLTPKFILRRISNIRGFSDVNYLFRGVRAVTGHLLDFKAGR
jgi:radical SAM superfamily enzyme YgiQ (UPF0313 family)